MKIEILGTGCKSCDTLYTNVMNALKETGLTDSFKVEKIGDMDYFFKMGVFTTPGLVVEGEVVASGRVLSQEQITDILKNRKS